MIGGVRVQIADTQLGRGLLDGAGLLDQGGDGVTHQLLAFGVVGRDQLIEVHVVLLGAVDQRLQLGFGFLQVGLEGGIGLGIDRRVMLFTDAGIRETILFPLLKPEA